MDLSREKKVAIKAALAAGAKILEIYRDVFEVEYKSDKSPVTRADLEADAIINGYLMSEFPNDGYLSEEEEDDFSRFSADRYWLIDPLDGTKEFVKKNGEFTVNIALVDSGSVILSVVYIPVEHVLYYAVKGEGAFKIIENKEYKLSVSNRKSNLRMLISRSRKSPKTLALLDRFGKKFESVIPKGSSLKGCLIAEGKSDVYYNFGKTMKWDTGAMDLIIKESGGIIKTLKDQEINYNEECNVNLNGFYILNLWENKIKIQQ